MDTTLKVIVTDSLNIFLGVFFVAFIILSAASGVADEGEGSLFGAMFMAFFWGTIFGLINFVAETRPLVKKVIENQREYEAREIKYTNKPPYYSSMPGFSDFHRYDLPGMMTKSHGYMINTNILDGLLVIFVGPDDSSEDTVYIPQYGIKGSILSVFHGLKIRYPYLDNQTFHKVCEAVYYPKMGRCETRTILRLSDSGEYLFDRNTRYSMRYLGITPYN